jgi:hypothetical protein
MPVAISLSSGTKATDEPGGVIGLDEPPQRELSDARIRGRPRNRGYRGQFAVAESERRYQELGTFRHTPRLRSPE